MDIPPQQMKHTNKGKIAFMIVASLILVVFAISKINFHLCYGDTSNWVDGSPGVFSPNGEKAYVLVSVEYLQSSVGMCAMLGDEGTPPKILQQSLDAYEIDLATKTATRIFTKTGVSAVYPAGITYRYNDIYYANFPSDVLNPVLLKIDAQSGSVTEISKSDYPPITDYAHEVKSQTLRDSAGRYIAFEGGTGDRLKDHYQYVLYDGSQRQVLLDGYKWLPYPYKLPKQYQ